MSIKITNASQLTDQVFKSGTKLELPLGHEFRITREIRWEGVLHVIGNFAAIKNDQPCWGKDARGKPFHTAAPAFRVTDGKALFVTNLFGHSNVEAGKRNGKTEHACNRFILQTGGYVEARTLELFDGWGWECHGGSLLWVGGMSNSYAYGFYSGSPSTAGPESMVIVGVMFHGGRQEAGFRIMGGRKLRCTACKFHASKHHKKPSAAIRHIDDAELIDCTFESIDIGPLEGDIAHSIKRPVRILVKGGANAGHVEVAGNTTFRTAGGHTVTGKDARGIGGSAAFNFKWLPHKGKKMRGVGASEDTHVAAGFAKFAADGWNIGQGCTLRAKVVK